MHPHSATIFDILILGYVLICSISALLVLIWFFIMYGWGK